MKIGLIGVGYWGRNYIKTIEGIKDLELIQVCSPNRTPEIQLPKYCRFTHNYQDLLDDKNIEGIIISTPPKTHYELTKSALNSGKNVLVEKPMTTSSLEALELYKTSKDKSLVLMIGHIYLYHPFIKELKEEIDKKEDFGKIEYLNSIRAGPGPIRNDIDNMWNLAPHDISIFNYLTGETPISVRAESFRTLESKLNDSTNLTLYYKNGMTGFIHTSWIEPIKRRDFITVGENKSAFFQDSPKSKLIFYNRKSGEESLIHINLENINPLKEECFKFKECIQNKQRPLSDGYNGYENVSILEAATKSINEKREIEIILQI